MIWRLALLEKGKRPDQLTLDIDGLPIEVHGHQGGSAFHGHSGARIYSPLIASLAETGDMMSGLLSEGNASPAENVDTWDSTRAPAPRCCALTLVSGTSRHRKP